jgi:hypothetical protein
MRLKPPITETCENLTDKLTQAMLRPIDLKMFHRAWYLDFAYCLETNFHASLKLEISLLAGYFLFLCVSRRFYSSFVYYS